MMRKIYIFLSFNFNERVIILKAIYEIFVNTSVTFCEHVICILSIFYYQKIILLIQLLKIVLYE